MEWYIIASHLIITSTIVGGTFFLLSDKMIQKLKIETSIHHENHNGVTQSKCWAKLNPAEEHMQIGDIKISDGRYWSRPYSSCSEFVGNLTLEILFVKILGSHFTFYFYLMAVCDQTKLIFALKHFNWVQRQTCFVVHFTLKLGKL